MMRVLAALNGLVNVAGGAAPAAHSAYVILLLRGTADGKPFLMSDGVGVGYGARPDPDGIDAVYFVAQENYPVEFLELGYPVRLLRYGINRDSGGPGRQRGGCGIVREYEILADHAVLAMRIDGVLNPPWGVAGGMGGGSGRAVVNPGTARERVLAPLSDGNVLVRGDMLLLETGGGGGHGHPFDRPLKPCWTTCWTASSRQAAARSITAWSSQATPRRGSDGRPAGAARRLGRLPPPGVCRCARMTAAPLIAVDIGGTFTDITVQDASGRVMRAKTPSTPADPSEAFITGVGLALRAAGAEPAISAGCCMAPPSPRT